MTSRGEFETSPGNLIYRGAEADIIKGVWRGLPAVYKVRRPLPYRLPSLDTMIRRQRTVREAELVHSARVAGVSVPWLYYVDPSRTTLVMEFVGGPRLKELLIGRPRRVGQRIFRELGKSVARLHSNGITHGDLTTANMIVREGGLVFLDFGLASHSTRLEDHAVDLRLVKETLAGAHPSFVPTGMAELLFGYSAEAGAKRALEVERQLRNIERRGRYARVA